MKPKPDAAPATSTRRIRNTDRNPTAVENATKLVTQLQQDGWTAAEITYRYVISSWTGDSYDAVDLSGTRLEEVLTKLAKS